MDENPLFIKIFLEDVFLGSIIVKISLRESWFSPIFKMTDSFQGS